MTRAEVTLPGMYLGAAAHGVSTLIQQTEDIERLWREDPTSGHVLVMLRELRGCVEGWMTVLRERADATGPDTTRADDDPLDVHLGPLRTGASETSEGERSQWAGGLPEVTTTTTPEATA